MNRKCKLSLMFIQIFAMFFLLTGKVMAAPTISKVVHIDSDLYYVEADSNGSTISAYVVGESKSNALSFMTSSERTYITLPNGTFYLWVKDTSGQYSEPYTINVTDSCSVTYAYNKTDTGHYERCYLRYTNGTEKAVVNASSATCASGYNMDAAYSTISANDCGNKNPAIAGLEFRYCRKEYAYKCVKIQTSGGTSNPGGGGSTNPGGGGTSNPGGGSSSDKPTETANAKLSSLSISGGSLTPNFSANTYSYAATTNSDKVTISAMLANSTASFVDGYGPRTVSLNYGTNTILIKTKDGNTVNTYTLKIKRADNRSSDNTLSSLKVSSGEMSPTFSALTTSYEVKVGSDVDSVDISATLNNSKSSFVDKYGPRTVKVEFGYTRASIKVKSESGSVRTYSFLFIKDSGGIEWNDPNQALLESLELSDGTIDFDPETFDYNVKVSNDVTNIVPTYKTKTEGDKVDVVGGENLETDKLNEISIVVTSKDGSKSNTYTIYVTRKEEDLPPSSNSLLSDLKIKDYKIKFDAKTTEYSVKAKDGIKELVITATPSDDKSVVTIEGNEDLKDGSKIKIRVTAEDGSYTDYFIEVKMITGGGNWFLTLIVILLILAALAYLVLRVMGYKIYFNLDAVKDKIVGLFKKE